MKPIKNPTTVITITVAVVLNACEKAGTETDAVQSRSARSANIVPVLFALFYPVKFSSRNTVGGEPIVV